MTDQGSLCDAFLLESKQEHRTVQVKERYKRRRPIILLAVEIVMPARCAMMWSARLSLHRRAVATLALSCTLSVVRLAWPFGIDRTESDDSATEDCPPARGRQLPILFWANLMVLIWASMRGGLYTYRRIIVLTIIVPTR